MRRKSKFLERPARALRNVAAAENRHAESAQRGQTAGSRGKVGTGSMDNSPP